VQQWMMPIIFFATIVFMCIPSRGEDASFGIGSWEEDGTGNHIKHDSGHPRLYDARVGNKCSHKPGITNWEFRGNHLLITLEYGGERELSPGECVGEWNSAWVGSALAQMAGVLERTSSEGGGYLLLFASGEGYHISKAKYGSYDYEGSGNFYRGYKLETILERGNDVLGEEVLKEGEPSYEGIVSILPPIKEGSYAILGSPTSWGKAIVDQKGDIMTQPIGGRTVKIFSAVEECIAMGKKEEIGEISSQQALLDDWMPIILTRLRSSTEMVELIYFVMPGETHRYPIIRVCMSGYSKWGGKVKWRKFYSLKFNGEKLDKIVLGQEQFYDRFIATIMYWLKFRESIATINVPDSQIYRWFLGCLAQATVVFSGDTPHYGARGYADERSDHFPPNYLTSAEAFFLSGELVRARRIIENFLAHSVDPSGRIAYWQMNSEGEEIFATSGTEYGQLLWLINLLDSQLEPKGWIIPYLATLEDIGDFLSKQRIASPEAGGKRLIRLGAEADNADRIRAYVGNNLWAVRGFWALGDLLKRYGREESGGKFTSESDDLFSEVMEALRMSEESTKYGCAIPFCFGYPKVPWTLSYCQAPTEEVDEESFQKYLNSWSWGREIEDISVQDFLENTYANYRYYPEMLSSMLLKPEWIEAILAMRHRLGGELLGMCRFANQIDDWPEANYARFLLSTDRIDEYLLLYYAHMCHHGRRDVLTYYEQVTADGRVVADDCIPSLLLVPTMTAWMFAFVPPHEQALYLCRATPRRWLQTGQGFAVNNIMSFCGPVSLEIYRDNVDSVKVKLELPEKAQTYDVYLDLRLPDRLTIKSASCDYSAIADLAGPNRLRLKKGLSGPVTLFLSLEGREGID